MTEKASALQSVAVDSRLWRGLLTLTHAWAVAWDRSSVGRIVARSAVRLRQATPAGRLRTGASIAAWACAWHLAGLIVLPRYATSGLPRAWFVAAFLVALVVALAADAFVRAWGRSALRRVLSRFAT
ncbi:MAG: hypothetical protein Q8O42_02135 [Acidobacteriota bacterium]|nr:hypothetical protein [Acidobacteriota bacterium]